ncbi:galactosyl transferase GMA12/MNN10 family-domain-containing protein [Myxozyma melibiosi]|uniref:Galactosyl transferase GMA12/MNN10 family-domain-containing protein n=1 Tax=Myxozyma melibiosi TaxID=54550 RepID=A0ABR1F265_9ASCO
MHFAIPSRAADQSLPGSPTFKMRSKSKNYAPPLLSQLWSSVFASESDSFERKRRSSRRSAVSAAVLLVILVVVAFFFVVYFVAVKLTSSVQPDGPSVVLVLGLDYKAYKNDYLQKIIDNRKEYADAQGYGLYVRDIHDFDSRVNDPEKNEWKKMPLIRAAIDQHPRSDYFWYLDQNALIMNPNLNLEEHITDPKKLNTLVLRDIPIVPPDGTIRTYRHVPADRMKFIISQDHEGLQTGSFILKNEEYSKFVLDSWSDKLYQEYTFAKKDKGALEHLAQWHPTVLSKMAVIPQRTFNSYPNGVGESLYQDGDFVASFAGCEAPERNCIREFERLWDNRGRVVVKK